MLFTFLIHGLPLLDCWTKCFGRKHNKVASNINSPVELENHTLEVQPIEHPLMQHVPNRSDADDGSAIVRIQGFSEHPTSDSHDGSAIVRKQGFSEYPDGSAGTAQSPEKKEEVIEECVGEKDCSICFEVIKRAKDKRICINKTCKKQFCRACITGWALTKESHTCPYCYSVNFSSTLLTKELNFVEQITQKYEHLPINTKIITGTIVVTAANALEDMEKLFNQYKKFSEYLGEMESLDCKNGKLKDLMQRIKDLPHFKAIASAESIMSGF